MRFASAFFVLLTSIASLASASATAPTTSPTTNPARALYDRVVPSLVVVQYTYDGELGRRELSTSGVVVRDDGLVMFSMAIVPMAIPDEQITDFKIIVPGHNEDEIDAEFQGRDERTELALVKPKESRKWKSLSFEELPLEIGDTIYSVGILPKDAGYKPFLTSAIVSAELRGPVPQVLVSGGGLGSVGSPVFNAAGNAVGIVHAQSDHYPILNDPRAPLSSALNPARLFIPAHDFMITLKDPPAHDQPLKLPWIGIAQLSGLKKEVAEYFDLKDQPAAQVGDVIPDMPADKAGIKSGDVIVKVNGKPLERGDEPDETPLIMTRKLQRLKVGDVVTFSILRGKDKPLQEIKVTLGERPMQSNRAQRFWAEDLGFTARQLVFDDTYVRKLPADEKGVVVALVKPSSSAQNAKLQNGDLITKLNQTPVENLEQFKSQYEAFRKDKPHEAVVIEVLRGVSTQIVRIEPPQ